MIKYIGKPEIRGQRVCFTRATTRHNSKQSNIHHTSFPELSFSLVFFYSLCYRISGEHIFLARTSISALFKNIIAHIYKLNIELCDVAHGPKSLATPGQENFNFELVNLLSTRANGFSKVTNELLWDHQSMLGTEIPSVRGRRRWINSIDGPKFHQP